MKKVNLEKEWEFIRREIHKEKPNSENSLKRELLLTLQILLSRNDLSIYGKTKSLYLK